MKVLLVSATPFEIAPLLQGLEEGTLVPTHPVEVLITGVGMTAAAFALGRRLAADPPTWVLQAGVAGSFDPAFPPGSVVQVLSETFADLAVEESDGSLVDLFALGLIDADTHPFRSGRLWNDAAEKFPFLPAVHALTVHCVTGAAAGIAGLKHRYPYGQIETMEGAAAFYACLVAGVPFAQVRAISNRVEPRNRANWKLQEAIDNLCAVLAEMI